ncbi:MAG: hypothetical protein KC656_15200 [Myxococcales bacterium]|nr:hypothetical protein [Myxococcales bacterium]MCB9668244.1 hypothetical protein [Alphaproteobacteria bacterium]MCB9692584.1 hypothetical protein [Alphaproteobacteria bacterium]
MRQGLMVAAMAVLAAGCSRVQDTDTQTFSSLGVGFVQGTTQAGRISYDGSAVFEEFTVTTTMWGTGSSRSRAERHLEDGGRANIGVDVDTLLVEGTSGYRSGVDFDILGPGVINTDLYVQDGSVNLYNVTGYSRMEGDRLYGRGIAGEGDFIANGGDVDLQLFPYIDGALIVVDSSGGDVQIGLPLYLDYDLTVTGDPDYDIVVDDLGFDPGTIAASPGLFLARRGFRDVRVDVFATGGTVQIYGI